jgi:hypothetical protein
MIVEKVVPVGYQTVRQRVATLLLNLWALGTLTDAD